MDRILVAQAQAEGLVVVTADPKLALYGVGTFDAGQRTVSSGVHRTNAFLRYFGGNKGADSFLCASHLSRDLFAVGNDPVGQQIEREFGH